MYTLFLYRTHFNTIHPMQVKAIRPGPEASLPWLTPSQAFGADDQGEYLPQGLHKALVM